jgi:hypothetical protein
MEDNQSSDQRELMRSIRDIQRGIRDNQRDIRTIKDDIKPLQRDIRTIKDDIKPLRNINQEPEPQMFQMVPTPPVQYQVAQPQQHFTYDNAPFGQSPALAPPPVQYRTPDTPLVTSAAAADALRNWAGTIPKSRTSGFGSNRYFGSK